MGNFPSNAHCIKYRSKLPYVLDLCMCTVCAKATLWMGIVCTDAVALMVVSSEWWSNEKYLCFYLYFLQRLFFHPSSSFSSAHSLYLPFSFEYFACKRNIFTFRRIYSIYSVYVYYFLQHLLLSFRNVCEYHYFLIMIVISCSCANRRRNRRRWRW